MAYEVVIDPGVVALLDEAVGYVMEVLGSPGAAADMLDSFDELIGRHGTTYHIRREEGGYY